MFCKHMNFCEKFGNIINKIESNEQNFEGHLLALYV